MPAFRWIDKTTGDVFVSNQPKYAARIERAHSDGNGLLADPRVELRKPVFLVMPSELS